MAVTPEELEEIKTELATRMGGKPANPFDPSSTMREGESPAMGALGSLGDMAGGGMGFGGINAASAQAPIDSPFDPSPEKLLVDPAGMDAGAAAKGGFSSSMSLANALRNKGGGGGGQGPQTTPLPD